VHFSLMRACVRARTHTHLFPYTHAHSPVSPFHPPYLSLLAFHPHPHCVCIPPIRRVVCACVGTRARVGACTLTHTTNAQLHAHTGGKRLRGRGARGIRKRGQLQDGCGALDQVLCCQQTRCHHKICVRRRGRIRLSALPANYRVFLRLANLQTLHPTTLHPAP